MRGKLSKEDSLNKNSVLDFTDIPLQVSELFYKAKLAVSYAFACIQHRYGMFIVDSLHLSAFKNDGFIAWYGGIYIEDLIIDHNLPYIYTRQNHSDCFHVQKANHHKSSKEDFDGLYIGSAICNVTNGRKKNGFLFTEVRKHKNIELFINGLIYMSTAINAPYVIDSVGFQNAVIGSYSYPIDPDKISNKGIRIARVKPNCPESKNIELHVYSGQKIILDDQSRSVTKIFTYEKHWTKQDRMNYYVLNV
jgi:hypothetical protein